jgi:hypothetical protein
MLNRIDLDGVVRAALAGIGMLQDAVLEAENAIKAATPHRG